MRIARVICEVRQTPSLYWWEWFFIDCVRWCEQDRYAKGPQRNGEQFGFTSAIYFQVNALEEYRVSIDRYIQYIDYRSQYERIQIYVYVIIIRQSSKCGYLTTNYLRQTYIFGVIIAIVVFASVCSTCIYCLLEYLVGRNLRTILHATCEQQSRLCFWNGCFVILAIHHLTWSIPCQSSRYNNNLLDLFVQINFTICGSKYCKQWC